MLQTLISKEGMEPLLSSVISPISTGKACHSTPVPRDILGIVAYPYRVYAIQRYVKLDEDDKDTVGIHFIFFRFCHG
jgi:hypothetical protein